MTSGTSIIINGKFLSAAPTGVHRVAEQLANAFAELADERNLTKPEMWIPWDGARRSDAMRMPVRRTGPFRSIAWEQITLPLRAGRHRMILSLCNIAPMLSRNAITMIHDAQVHIAPRSYRRGFRLWYKLVQPIVTRRNRLILTVSDFSRHQLAAAGLGQLDRIRVIHNGVDHILANPADRAVIDRLGLDVRRYVVALASTQSHKNIGLLIRAFSNGALAGLKLVLIGNGRAEHFAAAGHAPSSNCIFAGRVSDAELRALYEHALCLAFPSTTEGFGLPPLEAMRVGCPAVVAPCGALPEICGDAAVYAGPHDPDAWVAAISALATNPEHWAERATAAIAQASRFTWRRAAEQLAAVLDEARS